MDKGKVLFKKSAFYGDAKITNKAVSGVLDMDKKKVVNTAAKRKDLYRKFKDFGRKGRGLTDKEAKMALAELKYGNDDHLSKKNVDILANELGLGRGSITKKILRKAKGYKQRTSYTAPNSIVADIRKKADQRVTKRRENYSQNTRIKAKNTLETSKAQPIRRVTKRRDVRSQGTSRDHRESHHLGFSNARAAGNTRRVQDISSSSAIPKLKASSLRQHSAVSSVSALGRLSSGMRGRFGASHSNFSRLR